MQKITTHLWFDKEAKEAAEFYAAAFPDTKTLSVTQLKNTPSGTVDVITLKILDQEFTFLNAGPFVKFNPSVSFMIACKTKDEVTALWEKLSADGMAMMELGEYPFSAWYGWVQDKFGISWQIMFSDQEITQRITPTMMFVGDQYGKAEDAVKFYASVFHNSNPGEITRYSEGEEPDKAGTVKFVGFQLEGQQFAAMDSGRMHDFSFNEAISFIVHCENQAEVDYYWDKLSAHPESEQCGWLKDKFGFSWQVDPIEINKLLQDKDEAKVARLTEAFLKMKKFDIATLRAAFDGK